jgi:hypothetical protein
MNEAHCVQPLKIPVIMIGSGIVWEQVCDLFLRTQAINDREYRQCANWQLEMLTAAGDTSECNFVNISLHQRSRTTRHYETSRSVLH